MNIFNLIYKPILPFVEIELIQPQTCYDYENRPLDGKDPLSSLAIQPILVALSEKDRGFYTKYEECITFSREPTLEIEGGRIKCILSQPLGVNVDDFARAAIRFAKLFNNDKYRLLIQTEIGVMDFHKNDDPVKIAAHIVNARIIQLNNQPDGPNNETPLRPPVTVPAKLKRHTK